jgi:hypothetical protein
MSTATVEVSDQSSGYRLSLHEAFPSAVSYVDLTMQRAQNSLKGCTEQVARILCYAPPLGPGVLPAIRSRILFSRASGSG